MRSSVLSVIGFSVLCLYIQEAYAADGTLQTEWGGHGRGIVTVGDPDARSIYRFVDTSTAYDGHAELRLNNRTFAGSHWSVETHYELVALGGDTLERNNRLRAALPGEAADRLIVSQVPNDRHRLMDLTRRFSTRERSTAYHRLDRFNVSYSPAWGSVRLGRQALTWGDGQVFNPMDLFNPFAPTAVQRDYKTGDDMLHARVPVAGGDIQMLHVPRRNRQTGEIEQTRSSTAAKWHAGGGSLEADLMLARHYDEPVAGVGASGYLGGAVWRTNAVYTQTDGPAGDEDFLQFIANLDYAWTWGGRNVYGVAEFYYNGLGTNGDYAAALTDPAVFNRLQRGELFTLGKHYLAGAIQLEWHPLLRFHLTSIVNTGDPSGIVQPQLLWDVSGESQLIAGFDWHWGDGGTEFGGFETDVSGADVQVAPTDRLHLWWTYHF